MQKDFRRSTIRRLSATDKASQDLLLELFKNHHHRLCSWPIFLNVNCLMCTAKIKPDCQLIGQSLSIIFSADNELLLQKGNLQTANSRVLIPKIVSERHLDRRSNVSNTKLFPLFEWTLTFVQMANWLNQFSSIWHSTLYKTWCSVHWTVFAPVERRTQKVHWPFQLFWNKQTVP